MQITRTRRQRSTCRFLVALPVAVLVLASCGSDDDEGSTTAAPTSAAAATAKPPMPPMTAMSRWRLVTKVWREPST